MKAREFCADGQRPGAAIREIKADLCGRLVRFSKGSDDYWLLSSLEMVKCSNGVATYWRAHPIWERFCVSYNDEIALQEIEDGTFIPLQRAGGSKYDEEIKELYDLLKNGVIEL